MYNDNVKVKFSFFIFKQFRRNISLYIDGKKKKEK